LRSERRRWTSRFPERDRSLRGCPCLLCSSCCASGRESKRYPNRASHFPAISDCVFGISSGGDDARVAIRHGKRTEKSEGCLQNLPVGFHRQNQLVQQHQIMGTGEANGGFFEPGLEVLFSALLGMENSGIITRVLACAGTYLRDMPVFLGLVNPLKRGRLRTALCPAPECRVQSRHQSRVSRPTARQFSRVRQAVEPQQPG